MPEIDLDFGSVGQVPEGWFRLTCDKAIFKPNKSKDGYIINLQMRLIDMPEEFEAYENTMVFDNVSMKLAARWRLKDVLSAFTGDDWSDDGMKLQLECEECDEDNCAHQKNVPALVDHTAIGLIYGEDYQGRISARVKNYLVDDGAIEFGPDMTE